MTIEISNRSIAFQTQWTGIWFFTLDEDKRKREKQREFSYCVNAHVDLQISRIGKSFFAISTWIRFVIGMSSNMNLNIRDNFVT